MAAQEAGLLNVSGSKAGAFSLDHDNRSVRRRAHLIALGEGEFQALQLLFEADGQVVSMWELSQRLWGDHEPSRQSRIRAVIRRLRRKLGHPDPIETIGGEGYRLAPATPQTPSPLAGRAAQLDGNDARPR